MHNSISSLISAVLFATSGALANGNELRFAYAPIPASDRWMYPFNATPGTRTIASTFSALPENGGVDDRFGQFLLKFDTVVAGIPAGLGPENYDLQKVVLTAVLAASENISYDPTEDSRTSYGPSSTADLDAGRPLELHGTGFRSGFTAAAFQENSAFGLSAPAMRNAYALGFSPAGEPRDVSHNVTLGFDALPWAVGKVVVTTEDGIESLELAPGAPIPVYAKAIFALDLSLPGVAAYVRQSLHQGFIWLTISSLHPVAQQAVTGYPSYFTKDHPEQILFGDVAPSLDVEFTLPLRVVEFTRDSLGNTTLRWNGSPGFQYTVEASNHLASGSWSPLETFTANIPKILNWNGNRLEPRTFFRIARTPLP